ncbi:KAP family NTPase [Clostridioides difficile]|uniref:KAP family P-loop NTPase fold protein n=1 Tax=Clostridioides difficile TaxID=1496 RepID=UPI001C1D8346|nr:KAP family NTPase [Clostridioides difficile]MBY1715179.1 KAP family NTPase [Clostridioides difficile]MBZ0643169.1 KAP family NTPase [Clostridioides difficile]MBZ0648399.1 KAP family NTPase [Clostridioides difficile]MCA0724213.1 KAP family NTPase [Clostridioides difficile]
MGLFNNKIKINEENPFEHDKLWRKGEIESLTNLFELVDNQMVLAINSPWGTGKTTFLRIWESFLKSNDELKSKYEVIYFNAWENDDCLDPLVSIMGEMKESIEKVNKTNWDNIKEKGKKIVKKLTPVVIKVATAGLVSPNDVHLDDKVKDSIIDVSGNLFDVDEYVEQKEIRKEFEKELKEYQEKLGKIVIFFIDELDRCRPTFAIETLERVKHLFNLENFIFVLGIDKESLSNSIKVIYGDGTDINGYLARFIDMEYVLNENGRTDYIKYLLKKYTSEQIDSSIYNNLSYIVPKIVDLFRMSLRDSEKFIITLYLISKTNGNTYTASEIYLVSFLLALNKFYKSLYFKIKNKTTNLAQLTKELDEKISIEKWFDENEIGFIVKGRLMRVMCDVDMYNEMLNKSREFENMNIEKQTNKVNTYQLCLNECSDLNSMSIRLDAQNELKEVIKLVDIYSRFERT